jgi:hypothetical protein
MATSVSPLPLMALGAAILAIAVAYDELLRQVKEIDRNV